MRYYETLYEDYINAVKRYNIFETSEDYKKGFPIHVENFENLIIYGPVGSGKYSQMLYFLKQYSPSDLKYEKKMTISNEKQNYTFHISDIHYEIDMALLGCNSKSMWSDIFFQIVDIVSVKSNKIGIIVCKNFHHIHTELLDVFYSYMQQYNAHHDNIILRFVLITEHLSFIPMNIMNACEKIHISKPSKDVLKKIAMNGNEKSTSFVSRIMKKNHTNNTIMNVVDTNDIVNIKETYSFDLIKNESEIPKDIFNIICDNIIALIDASDKFDFSKFRDALYEILIYNLDIIECVWYILSHFILIKRIKPDDISDILHKTYSFLKYYNNNYRPIYHLESIMFYIITKIENYDDNR